MQHARHHKQPSALRAATHSLIRAGRPCVTKPPIRPPADGASLLATRATAGRFPIIRAFWRQPWLLLPALFLWTVRASGQNVIAWGGNASGQTNIPASATNVIQVAAGGSHSLALRSDGSVVGWGAGVMVPASATNVVQISAGVSHSVALKADGRVVAWGSSIYGQSIVPASATNVITIAAGNDHNLALRSNGTLVAWGNNNFGQTKIPTYCTNVSAIAAGGDLSLALCSDGVCVVWGRNGTRRAFRQPNDTVALSAGGWQMLALTASGTLASDGGLPPPAEATNVVVAATGTNYSLALRADGTVIAWGDGSLTNVPADAFEIVALSAGPSHCLAVKSLPLPPRILGPVAYRDGALFGQRLPLFAQAVGATPLSYQWFANGDSIPGATSARPEFVADFTTDGTAYQVMVSNPYGATTSAISRVGTRGLSVWGDDPYLQSRVPATAWYPRSVSAGEFHCLALTTNGTVKAWGKSFAGQTTVPSSATNVVAVAAGSDHSLALRADGSVVGWGSDASSQSKVPATVRGAVAISTGRAHSLALLTNGTLVAWGDDITGQRQIPLFARNTIAIASGYLHNLALQADGTVVTAGLDYPVPASATDVVAIAAGWEHCLALRGDGSVVAWGDDSFGQAQVPPSATNVVAIACGYYHNLAMRADGSLVAWGNGFRNATTMPPGDHTLAAFAGGEHFTMALVPFGPPQFAPPVPSIRAREAGSAVLSGVVSGAQPLRLQWLRDGVEIPGATNQFLLLKHVTPAAAGSYVLFASNALGRATANPISLTVVPGIQPIGGTAQWRQAPYGRIYAASPSLPPVCSISSGGFHTLALHTDGTVVAWGKNRDGQCNVPITATAIVAVAAGGDHSLALRGDGTVVAWGRNWDGQASVPASASNVIAIAAGWAHSLALRSDGTVVAWGNNEYGQTDVSVIATDLKAISAGYYHSMGLRADGLVMTWGLDYPIPPEATNIVAIKAGWQHCLALRPDGSVLAWGDNYHGHCNVPPSATNITAFASAYYCSVALRADGSLVSWGTNRFEYSGAPELSLPAVGLEAQEDTHAVLLSSGPPAFGHHFASVSVRLNGPLTLCPAVVGATNMQFQWLLNGQPVSGATGRCLTISRTAAADAGAYVLVAWNDQGVTFSQAISVTVDSTTAPITRVGGWGDNHRGQLLVPHALTSPRSISARAQHALAVDAEGAVHAWGKNTAVQTNVPPAATNVVAVAAGGGHSLALRTDGAVVAWGGNWDGQCDVPTPLTNAVAIAAGMAHSLALRADGTVLAWGNNAYGQTNVSPLATNVLAIAAGYCHSLALLADHTVVCWGTTLPVPAAATNAVAIAGGLDHSLVLRADGAVVAWGRNDYGQCSVPPSATNVVAVAAGLGRSLALLADGTVLAWGRQFLGLTPMPPGLRDVAAIAAGEDFDLAMVLVGPPVATTAPAMATAPVGATAILAANCAGSQPLTSQWFFNGAPVSGANSRFLRLANVPPSAAGEYTLVVSNSAGQTASVSTELAIQTAPVLATKPVHKPVLPGAPLCLSAEVHGLPPMTFHWLKDGSVLQDSSTLVGAHSLTLCLSAAAYADTGVYSLAVSNAFGGITSRVAQVVVTPVVAWGDDSASQLQIPPQAISLVALASREDHNLALRTDGSVVAWGDNTFGQNLVPAQASNVVAVAEGSSHCLALRADGKVVAWGDNSYGKASVPNEATNVVAIAAGQHLSLALRADGTVVLWGESYGTSSIPVWATNIVGIAARDLLPYYLRSDGGVITAPASTLVSDGLALASGPAHTLILREDGGLTGFGVNHYGQATAPASALDIVAVAAGGTHSLAARMDGSLLAWGGNDFGQTNLPLGASNVFALAAGGAHNLALVGDGTPRITLNPLSHLGYSGERVRLTARVASPAPLSYQWRFNGTDLPGATNAILLLPNLQWPQAGRYQLVASNALGVVISSEAFVTLPGSPLLLEGFPDANPASGRFLLKFRDLTGPNRLILYSSSNLLHWRGIFTNTPSTDWSYYLDSASNPPSARFYRLGRVPQ